MNGQRRLSVFIGTKGDTVKMAPVLRELEARDVEYQLVHTSQHRDSSFRAASLFGLRPPDVYLSPKPGDVTTIPQMARWYGHCLREGLRVGRRLFPEPGGYVLIHGDTETTIIGLLLARLYGQHVMHVEAGLRSLSARDPFPEEIHRAVADRQSTVLFAPDSVAASYIRRNDMRREVVTTNGNTVFDALRYVFDELPEPPPLAGDDPRPYAIAAIHRKETLYSRRRLRFAVETVLTASKVARVYFMLHDNTRYALVKRGLMSLLREAPNVVMYDAGMGYDQFMHWIGGAQFVVTDGGGLQEETWWLDRPCLVLRRRTERHYGLGETTSLAYFSARTVHYFLDHLEEFRRRGPVPSTRPSAVIADHVRDVVLGDSPHGVRRSH